MGSKYHAQAMAGDIESAHVYARYNERKCAMAGWSSVNIRLDPYNAQTEQQPTQYERISAAIMRVVNEAPPAQRAAIKRMEELGPEKALELLIAGNGAGPLPDDQNSANSEPFATPLDRERSDGSVCWCRTPPTPVEDISFSATSRFLPTLAPTPRSPMAGVVPRSKSVTVTDLLDLDLDLDPRGL